MSMLQVMLQSIICDKGWIKTITQANQKYIIGVLGHFELHAVLYAPWSITTTNYHRVIRHLLVQITVKYMQSVYHIWKQAPYDLNVIEHSLLFNNMSCVITYRLSVIKLLQSAKLLPQFNENEAFLKDITWNCF